MRRMMSCVFILGAITFLSSPAANAQMQIYGAWHCGNDACTWASVRNMTDFDTAFQLSTSNLRFGAGITREVGMDLVRIDEVLLDGDLAQPSRSSRRATDHGEVPNGHGDHPEDSPRGAHLGNPQSWGAVG